MEAQTTRDRVRTAVEDGARFYVSHSGGKDSQAMYAIVRELVPDEQIAVIHANLGRHEWTGIEAHIRANIAHPLHVVRASKTFSEMVRHRAKTRPDVPSFPSASQRQCTSDLKRGPIYKFIRGHMNEHKTVLGINCMGLRAEESPARRSREDWRVNRTLSNRKRTVYDWLPVQRLATAEVFERIRKAGQEPVPRVRGGKRAGLVRVLHPSAARETWRTAAARGRTCTGSTGSWSRRPDGRCSPDSHWRNDATPETPSARQRRRRHSAACAGEQPRQTTHSAGTTGRTSSGNRNHPTEITGQPLHSHRPCRHTRPRSSIRSPRSTRPRTSAPARSSRPTPRSRRTSRSATTPSCAAARSCAKAPGSAAAATSRRSTSDCERSSATGSAWTPTAASATAPTSATASTSRPGRAWAATRRWDRGPPWDRTPTSTPQRRSAPT